ncbi:fibronectin type III domain-containing protein [Bacteroidota bacterium]
MSQIKNGLKGKSVDVKIQYGEQLITSLTGNPNITIDPTKLTELSTNTGDLETKMNAADAIRVQSKTATQELNLSEDAFDKTVSDIAKIINGSLTDPDKLTSTGFPLVDEDTSSIPLVQVMNLSLTQGDEDGEIDAQWDPVEGATGYKVEITTDINDPTSWSVKESLGKVSKVSIKNLTSGTRYWVRVSAVRGDGNGAPSDPATRVSP